MINGYRQALFLFSVFFIAVCSTLWTVTIQAATRTKTHHLSQSKSIQVPPPTTAAPNTTSAATNTTTAAPANTTAAPTTNATTAAPATWRSRTRTVERSPQHQGTTTGASPSTTTHAPNTTSNQTTQAPQTTPTTTSARPTHHYYHSMTRTQQREEPSTTSPAPTAAPNTTSNTTTKAPAPETTTTPAPTQHHQRTATREMSRSPMSITPEGDRTSTVSPSTTIRAPTTTTPTTPAPPTTTQQQKEQTSTTHAQQQRGTSTTAAAVATTTDAPSPTPKPKKRNPRVEFVLDNIARGRTNTTAANFQTLLAEMLSIPANAMSVTYDESAGVMLVEFKEDATDSSGNTLNATAEFEKAVTLDTTQLNNLGAASVTSTEPAPAPEDNNNNDDDKKPKLGLILGIVGGVLVLAVVAYIVKVKSSGTTGSKYEESADPHGTGFVPSVGDRPMLEVPQHHSHRTQL